MSIHGGSGISRALARVPQGAQASIANEGIRFESRGTVLVIGPAQYVTSAAARLAASLRVLACATSGEIAQTDLRANPALMSCRIAAVTGYLGRFTATAHGMDGMVDMGPFSPNRDGFFDLVLDLSSPPLLAMAVKPLGYYAPGTDSLAIDAAIAELATFTGSFLKPRFYHFNMELCAHSAQGVAGCTRCLNVCPTGAISSSGDAILIDSNLCQGCATCMLACPTGAITYAAPSFNDIHKRLATSLGDLAGPGRDSLQLLIHEDTDRSVDDHLDSIDKPLVRFALPAIAAAGLDVWLTALVQGATQVIIKLPADLPESTRGELKAQVGVAQALLAAIGDLAERIIVIEGTQPIAPVTVRDGMAAQSLPAMSGGTTKRNVLTAALDRLQTSSGAAGSAMPASVDLPGNAPFGAVEVNRHSCTLCMACAYLCPTGALVSEKIELRLNFIESRCVQCRLCEHACPERSITLRQRLLLDADARQTARTLNKGLPHRCPKCAAPFIGRALLNKTLTIMRDQELLNDEELNQLRLCPSCRAQNVSNF
jgi:Fe-S-cluster-containing hydrogenase component 2